MAEYKHRIYTRYINGDFQWFIGRTKVDVEKAFTGGTNPISSRNDIQFIIRIILK